MSADNFSLFYCLTEAGWLVIDEGNPPKGWIRICELRVYQGSPFGQESRHWQECKTNPTWTVDAADQLEKKFPRPERSRELSPESLKALGITSR
jgi:hypothetical protein